MNRFDPLPGQGSIRDWLKQFIRMLESELARIEKKIPGRAPTAQETREALLNDPVFKDAIYRYIKHREARE